MNYMKLTPLMIAVFSALPAITPHLSYAEQPFSVAGNHMSYGDAKEYCDTLAGHLPSIRELALYAASQGATGIKESTLPDQALESPSVKAEIIENASQGYHMIQKKNLWMPAVDFYYNSNGFKPQADGAVLWTSSTNSSASSLVGGKISMILGTEQKYTLSVLDGSVGEDAANTGRDAVVCAMDAPQSPAPVTASAGSTIVTISPAQIEFTHEGKNLSAIISDSKGQKIETVLLDTSDLGRDAASIQISRDYCADQASKAQASNKNLKLDLSYQKPEKFCSISDDVIYPTTLSSAQ